MGPGIGVDKHEIGLFLNCFTIIVKYIIVMPV